MITTFQELLGERTTTATPDEIKTAISYMGDDDITESFNTDPYAMGFMLPFAIKKIKAAVKFKRALKKMTPAQRKEAKKGFRKKLGRRGIIAALPISPIGKLAALIAVRRKERKEKARKKAKARAAYLKLHPEKSAAAIIPTQPTEAPAYTPTTAPAYTPATTQATAQEPEQEQPEQEQAEQEKKPVNKMLIYGGLAAAAAAMFFLSKKKNPKLSGERKTRKGNIIFKRI